MTKFRAKSVRTFVITCCIGTLVYIDGFFALFAHLVDAGAYNPGVALVIVPILTTLLIKKRCVALWAACVLLFDFLILVTLACMDEGSTLKLFRDYAYIAIFLMSFLLIRRMAIDNTIDARLFALYLAILTIIAFPILGLITGMQGYDGRFPGFMLSPPIFANTVMISYLIARNARLGARWTWLLFCCASIFVFLSGTRSPLLTLIIYELIIIGSAELVSRNRTIYILTMGIGLSALAGVIVDFYGNIAGGHPGSRIFAQQDSDGGSLQTRSTWYYEIFESLAKDHYIGGFGAGAAERLTGYITHFDLLRYWYDYSVLYVVIFLCAIYKMYRVASRNFEFNSKLYEFILFPFIVLNVVLISMHNAFQAPGLVILFASYLNFPGVMKGGRK